jgi:STE24 endopeptidase
VKPNYRLPLVVLGLMGVAAALGAGCAFGDSPLTVGTVIDPVAIPTPSALSIRRYHSGNILWVVATLWGFLVPAVIFWSGLSARLRDWATRIGKRWYVALLLYFVAFTLIAFLADVALDYYSDFVRPHEYGLSAQAFGKWLQDEVIGLALTLVGGALVIWIPFLLLKHATKRWWLYTWFASIPLVLFLQFVQPIWIEPLFNDFGPMQDKVLETRILTLAHRVGIDSAKVYEVKKSVDTKELNAYVTGIGHTQRIVLWDTLLKAFTPDEISLVMGHEMGHYALGHTWKGLITISGAILCGLWLIHVSVGWVLRRYGERAGVRSLGDFASLPLLLLVFSLFGFVVTPLAFTLSRHFEHEADRFGLEITHDNHACATAFVKFVEHDLSYPTPSPFIEYLRYTHPSAAERITFCNTYHPWLEGKDGEYSSYFAPVAAK